MPGEEGTDCWLAQGVNWRVDTVLKLHVLSAYQHRRELLMSLIHPLQEVIDSKIPQKDAAKALGISAQHLCDLIHKRRGVGAKMALRVQAVFGVDAMAILIRQAAHDLARELSGGLKL